MRVLMKNNYLLLVFLIFLAANAPPPASSNKDTRPSTGAFTGGIGWAIAG